ncbi:MAG: tRNA lysidine(34) synthetase TilS [Ignavibacteriales bacterium]|nr:tRNA lysidine(34) synthetase TilS [Ignavibacteriales bacterium]
MPKETFLHTFQLYLRLAGLLCQGDKIIVAVSGGIDSMSLLDVLVRTKKEFDIQLCVVHFNHKLRAQESDEDEEFVRQTAERYQLPFYTQRALTADISEECRKSIQETARELRYEFFQQLRLSTGFNKIATAHNANDNAETVLFNLLRGTGVKGLCGIPASRPDVGIVRPLLFATRAQIREYAEEHSIHYREDSSNKKTDYSRNFLRHQVFPMLHQAINPNLTETLNRNAELFTLLDSYLTNQSSKWKTELVTQTSDDEIVIERESFLVQHEFVQYQLLHTLAKEFGKTETSFDTVKEMLSVMNAETGSWCPLNDEVMFYRDRNHLVFARQTNTQEFQVLLSPPERIHRDDFEFVTSFVPQAKFSESRSVEFIDASKLGKNIQLRNWKNGDWFIPFGMNERKKLSDYFVEQKIPRFKKRTIPILTSDENIVWVCGQRLDERYKLTSSTTSILKLEYEPLHG